MAPFFQELYGNTVAGQVLNCFSRLFTHFLQWYGLTCGFDDLLLLKGAEGRRQVGTCSFMCWKENQMI
jgi:DNA-directed RNA polymerase I subunit RPA1